MGIDWFDGGIVFRLGGIGGWSSRLGTISSVVRLVTKEPNGSAIRGRRIFPAFRGGAQGEAKGPAWIISRW